MRITARPTLIALTIVACTAGCTLRRVASSCSDDCGDGDAGGRVADASHADASDASVPEDAARRDASAPDTGVDPLYDAGPVECHPLEPACTAELPAIPLAGVWDAYWDADFGVETAPATGPDGMYLGVARWRSRLGDAVLEAPRDVAATFPDDPTLALRAPRFALDGWGRSGDACPEGHCLPGIRFERTPGTAAPSGEGTPLVSTSPPMLALVGAGRRTATIVTQVELAPDPDRRTMTLFSWGPASGTTPLLRGYVSGTTYREQSQVPSGSSLRVDFTARAERGQPMFVAYVIDLDADEPIALYTALGAGALARSGATSALDLVLPGSGTAKFTIGALGRGGVTDALDGTVRRFAVSSAALTFEQLTELADAWRAEDARRATDASTRYLNAIAASSPILFTRLANALPGPGLPDGAFAYGGAQVNAEACSMRFEAPSGMGGYLEIPDHDAYSIDTSGEGLSVEVWVRIDDPNPLGEPGPTGPKDYIHFLGKADSEQYEWAFRAYRADSIERPGRLSFYVWELAGGLAPGQYVQPSCERDVGRWIHLVGVADDPSAPGAGVRFYINGRPGVGTSNLYEAMRPENGRAPLRLGIRTPSASGLSGGYLVGALADFAIYPRVLSDAEITAHYEAASGTRY